MKGGRQWGTQNLEVRPCDQAAQWDLGHQGGAAFPVGCEGEQKREFTSAFQFCSSAPIIELVKTQLSKELEKIFSYNTKQSRRLKNGATRKWKAH